MLCHQKGWSGVREGVATQCLHTRPATCTRGTAAGMERNLTEGKKLRREAFATVEPDVSIVLSAGFSGWPSWRTAPRSASSNHSPSHPACYS